MILRCVHALTVTRQAVCGFFEGKPPEEWQSNHLYDFSREYVNCGRCLEILEAREQATQIALREEPLLDPPAGDPCW